GWPRAESDGKLAGQGLVAFDLGAQAGDVGDEIVPEIARRPAAAPGLDALEEVGMVAELVELCEGFAEDLPGLAQGRRIGGGLAEPGRVGNSDVVGAEFGLAGDGAEELIGAREGRGLREVAVELLL